MERVKNSDDKGRAGFAEIVKLSDTTLRVDIEADERNKAESFNITVTEESIPEYFPMKQLKINGKVKVRVTMNGSGDRILYANPSSGEFEGHYNKIPAPEGQLPVAETKKGKKGKDYKQFSVLIEVDNMVGTKALWKGCNYWTPFYPNFGADVDGNLAVAGAGSGSDFLFDMLEASGVSEHVIPFSENPLPEIERIAQEENRKFKFIVNKGWIDTFIAATPEGQFVEEEIGFTEEPVKEEPTIHPALAE